MIPDHIYVVAAALKCKQVSVFEVASAVKYSICVVAVTISIQVSVFGVAAAIHSINRILKLWSS